MSDAAALKALVFAAIADVLEDKTSPISDETRLFGEGSLLDSMKLVEVCLALEDRAQTLGFEFDWTSEAAMSKSRSMFRTAGSLAAAFISQMEAQK